MAVKDTSRKPYIEDNNTNVSIGVDLPIRRGDIKQGYFATTSTTIEAVINNIRNLLNTNEGERIFQPQLGLDLRKYLFEQITPESIAMVQDSIVKKIAYWLPFVTITDMRILTSDNDTDVGANSMLIELLFTIQEDPNTLDSVTLQVTSTGGGADVNISKE